MRRARVWLPIVSLGVISSFAALAFAKRAPSRVHAPAATVAAPTTNASTSNATLQASEPAVAAQTFPQLPAISFTSQNTGESARIELYDEAGRVNEAAAQKLDELLCDARDPKERAQRTLDRRTLQLVVRAALHFRVTQIEVVSAYRKPGRRSEGPHASGRAIDFKLPGVPARTLAAYLRTLPRVGVGVYTHPRTSFVHLDDREHSFHWLDASPPGRTWREMSIGNASLPKRDASYRRADDWPEGTVPSAEAIGAS